MPQTNYEGMLWRDRVSVDSGKDAAILTGNPLVNILGTKAGGGLIFDSAVTVIPH